MIELNIKGMTCGHCEQAVRKALAGVPGVTEVVEVNRGAERAVVEGTPALHALLAAIREEGYEARAA